MCTVTFIPFQNQVFITSNRDEKHYRAPAQAPRVHELSSGKVLFPQDPDAGGTWIALHENGNVVVFLNGGLVKHEPSPPYKKSRGLVLLDIINQEFPYQYFLEADLSGIEAFTAILWDHQELYECRWDGARKYPCYLNADEFHIWSSVTLYDEDIIRKREEWFENWHSHQDSYDMKKILDFHTFTGEGDGHNDLKMNRDGKVFTVSITGVCLNQDRGAMSYLDIVQNSSTHFELPFTKAPVT